MADHLANVRSAVATYFGRLAKTYGDGGYYTKRRHAVTAALRNEIPSGARFLDLGCGNGAYLADFRETLDCRTLLGADLSREMLGEASRRAPGVALVCCDAMAPPSRPRSWDVVFCSHVLQIVPNLEDCLAGVRRCLAPGGVLAIAAGESGFGSARLRDLFGDRRWALFSSVFPGVGVRTERRDHETACVQAGFAPVRKMRLPFTITGDEAAEWFRVRWMPFVPEQQRTDAERALSEMAAEIGNREIQAEEALVLASKPG